jgi:exodeoxyribonuclease VII small subunit
MIMAKEKFEDALEKLEAIVKKLETGELTLEESLKAFEEGIRLTRLCTGKLDDAERRVEVLLKEGDVLSIKSFQGNDS